jgi:hypothetical protein
MADESNPFETSTPEKATEAAIVALAAVPYAGGVLSSSASLILQKRQNRRLQRFISSVAEDLQDVKEQINKHFVQSESSVDLFENIINKASETQQQEKLDALRSVFINTVISTAPDYDEATEMADLIYRWQPRHIILLRILSDPRRVDKEMGTVVGEGGGFSTSINAILRKLLPQWDEEQIDRTWQELHDARIHVSSGTKTMITDKGIRHLEGLLTPFGGKVVSYLHNPKDWNSNDKKPTANHNNARQSSPQRIKSAIKCFGHLNNFEHFDHGISSLEGFDIGIKFRDEKSPPPPETPSEPRLYLYISIIEIESRQDLGTIHYARSRTYLQNGFPSCEVDRESMKSSVLSRLSTDIESRIKGNLHSSDENPIFI